MITCLLVYLLRILLCAGVLVKARSLSFGCQPSIVLGAQASHLLPERASGPHSQGNEAILSARLYAICGSRPAPARGALVCLQDSTYQEVEADANGRCKSTVFSGFWLDASALLRRDVRQVMTTLQRAIETPEHAAFVQRLQAGTPQRLVGQVAMGWSFCSGVLS